MHQLIHLTSYKKKKKKMWKAKGNTKKQVRKPISTNFAPKRLAINFQPPTLILEYLVTDTGKLYHHKMRLDSVLKKNSVSRQEVLNYIKTKHHLYFVSDKLKDEQILKFIDRILVRCGKSKPKLDNIQEDAANQDRNGSPSAQNRFNNDDDFDYLNDDDDEYEEDYEDYEEQPRMPTNEVHSQNKENKADVKAEEKKQKPAEGPKNTFMTYCQEQYDQENDEEEGPAEWDLDIEENGDFDFV